MNTQAARHYGSPQLACRQRCQAISCQSSTLQRDIDYIRITISSRMNQHTFAGQRTPDYHPAMRLRSILHRHTARSNPKVERIPLPNSRRDTNHSSTPTPALCLAQREKQRNMPTPIVQRRTTQGLTSSLQSLCPAVQSSYTSMQALIYGAALCIPGLQRASGRDSATMQATVLRSYRPKAVVDLEVTSPNWMLA